MQPTLTEAQRASLKTAWDFHRAGQCLYRIGERTAQAWKEGVAQALAFTPPGESSPTPAQLIDITQDVRTLLMGGDARRTTVRTERSSYDYFDAPAAVFFDPNTSTMHACGCRVAEVQAPEGFSKAQFLAAIEPIRAMNGADGDPLYAIQWSGSVIEVWEVYGMYWTYRPPVGLGGMGALHLALCEQAEKRLLNAGDDDLGQVAADLAERLHDMAAAMDA
ncbi:hypothetical protein [Azohydromonas aeria]|uniref:hypothetical protein n=1 Tax=Azohydromonas aeria TaxID=2590212 RepID=UPI0012F88C57|nr:hypothetical protein [Azohydromonas aeria]